MTPCREVWYVALINLASLRHAERHYFCMCSLINIAHISVNVLSFVVPVDLYLPSQILYIFLREPDLNTCTIQQIEQAQIKLRIFAVWHHYTCVLLNVTCVFSLHKNQTKIDFMCNPEFNHWCWPKPNWETNHDQTDSQKTPRYETK